MHVGTPSNTKSKQSLPQHESRDVTKREDEEVSHLQQYESRNGVDWTRKLHVSSKE
jgi:hypothetical protein